MNNKFKNSLLNGLGTIAMIVIALIIGGVLITISGNGVGDAYGAIIRGAFGSVSKITELFVKLCPILLMAFGISIAFKAQLWNIGAQGQFVIAGVASVAVALYIPVPFAIRIPLSLIAALVAGGFWGWIAAWLKNTFNAPEVISTLMLTYIANYFNLWMINGPMHDPYSDLPQSDIIPEAMYLPKLIGTYRLNAGIFIMLLVVVIMFFFWKSSLGYRVDLIGQGSKVAAYAGINMKKTVYTTLFISGAICGLAGWIEMFGIQYRLLDGLAADYSNIATIIALLGNLKVVGIIVSACFFSILLCGGSSMQRMTDVPYSIVGVIEGLIIIFIIAKNVVSERMIAASVKKAVKSIEKARPDIQSDSGPSDSVSDVTYDNGKGGQDND